MGAIIDTIYARMGEAFDTMTLWAQRVEFARGTDNLREARRTDSIYAPSRWTGYSVEDGTQDMLRGWTALDSSAWAMMLKRASIAKHVEYAALMDRYAYTADTVNMNRLLDVADYYVPTYTRTAPDECNGDCDCDCTNRYGYYL